MNTQTLLTLLAITTIASAGCLGYNPYEHALADDARFQVPDDFSGDAADLEWPDFSGATLRILDHGAFLVCQDLGDRFQELTGATVECTSEDDTGSALNRAVLGVGDPEFDVMYGADNLLMHQALDQGVFRPYTPQLADRVDPDLVFFDEAPWPATPVDHGYIALNVDHRHEALNGTSVDDLDAVRANADQFVTQDPRTSTPGLGFLLATVAVFGEDDWQDYWTDLFEGGVLVTSGWTEAYEIHFSGGYGGADYDGDGQADMPGHIGDRPIVTSYTESPAFEAYYGATEVADVLLTHGDDAPVLHQIQTMAVLEGTPNRAVAEAWIEFTLTDDFQVTAAPVTAVYPAVDSPATRQSVTDTYGTDPAIHPEPGTFDVAGYDFRTDGAQVEAWVNAWVDLCEAHDCT